MSSFLKYLFFWSSFKINSDWVILWYKWEPKNNLLVIPEEIWWVKVVEIWYEAFYQKWLKNVILPNSLKKIWDRAFAKNNIENLIIPDSVEEIWKYSFFSNDIKNLNIWKNTKYISNWAFYFNNIKNLYLPKNTKIIEYLAFCKKENENKYDEDMEFDYIDYYLNNNNQWTNIIYDSYNKKEYEYDNKNHIIYTEKYFEKIVETDRGEDDIWDFKKIKYYSIEDEVENINYY